MECATPGFNGSRFTKVTGDKVNGTIEQLREAVIGGVNIQQSSMRSANWEKTGWAFSAHWANHEMQLHRNLHHGGQHIRLLGQSSVLVYPSRQDLLKEVEQLKKTVGPPKNYSKKK